MITLSFKYNYILKALATSTSLTTFMRDSTGLATFNHLTPEEIEKYFPMVLVNLEAEVNSYGIKFIDTVNLSTDLTAMSTLLKLRNAFDQNRLQKSINDSTEVREAISTTLSDIVDEDILITKFIETFKSVFPLANMWSDLHGQRYTVTSSSIFVHYLQDLLENQPMSNDAGTTMLSRYMLKIYSHITRIKKQAATFCTRPDITTKYSDIDFNKYDADLARMPVDDIAFYLNSGVLHPLFRQQPGDTDFITAHKAANDHHFEYYITRGIDTPREAQLIKLVGEYCINEWGKDDCVRIIQGYLEKTKFTDAIKDRLVYLATEYKHLAV